MAWAPIVAAGVQAGGSLLGGMFGASGQQNTNAQQMQFAAEQAQMNRDWQERMSNTSYQRGMADMKAAGLNPILAANLGGASSPGGSMGSIGTLGNPGASMQQGVTSAAGAAQTAAAVKESIARAEKDDTQQDLNKAQTDTSKATTGLTMATTEKAKADTATSGKQLEVQDSTIKANNAAALSHGADAALSAARTIVAGHDANSAKARAQLEQDRADQYHHVGEGWSPGEILGTISKTTSTIGDAAARTVGGIIDRFRSGQGSEVPNSAKRLPSENPGLSGGGR